MVQPVILVTLVLWCYCVCILCCYIPYSMFSKTLQSLSVCMTVLCIEFQWLIAGSNSSIYVRVCAQLSALFRRNFVINPFQLLWCGSCVSSLFVSPTYIHRKVASAICNLCCFIAEEIVVQLLMSVVVWSQRKRPQDGHWNSVVLSFKGLNVCSCVGSVYLVSMATFFSSRFGAASLSLSLSLVWLPTAHTPLCASNNC